MRLSRRARPTIVATASLALPGACCGPNALYDASFAVSEASSKSARPMKRLLLRGWWRLTWAETACFALGAIFIGVAVGAGMAAARTAAQPRQGIPADQIEVVAPDTFKLTATGEWVRLADLSTPALPPRARCSWEAQMALVAKVRLQDLLADARRVELTPPMAGGPGIDSEGLLLRDLYVDGASVAAVLREAGLAHPKTLEADDWCRR